MSRTLIGLFKMGQLGGGAPSFYGESVDGLFVVPLPFTFDLGTLQGDI